VSDDFLSEDAFGRTSYCHDEQDLAYLIARILREDAHHRCLHRLPPGARPAHRHRSCRSDVICHDLMLPRTDGLSITRRVRQTLVPIFLSTALSTEIDKVLGLDLGAATTSPNGPRWRSCRHAITPSGPASNDAARSPRPSAPHPRRGCRPAGRPGQPGRDVRRREVILTREFDLLYLLDTNPTAFQPRLPAQRLWGDYGGFGAISTRTSSACAASSAGGSVPTASDLCGRGLQ